MDPHIPTGDSKCVLFITPARVSDRCQTSRDAKERPVVKAKGVLRFATLLQVRHRDGVYVVFRVYPEDRPLHIGLTKVAPAIAQIRLRRVQTLKCILEDSGAVVERDGVGHLAR